MSRRLDGQFRELTKASDHHSYGGKPSRGTPGDVLSPFRMSSSSVNICIKVRARVAGSFVKSQTGVAFKGPLVQSGKVKAEWAGKTTTATTSVCQMSHFRRILVLIQQLKLMCSVRVFGSLTSPYAAVTSALWNSAACDTYAAVRPQCTLSTKLWGYISTHSLELLPNAWKTGFDCPLPRRSLSAHSHLYSTYWLRCCSHQCISGRSEAHYRPHVRTCLPSLSIGSLELSS